MCGSLAYLVLYFYLELPNNSGIARSTLLRETPVRLLDLIAPTEPPPLENGWSQLSERVRPWKTSLLVVLAACGLGRFLLGLLVSVQQLMRAERLVLAAALGFSALSLLTLTGGRLGLMSSAYWTVLLWVCVGLGITASWRQRRRTTVESPGTDDHTTENLPQPNSAASACSAPGLGWQLGVLLLMAPFALCMLLGSALPPVDFDVREYHLQGPKEFYLQGQVRWLPHNVYTSFPFLTEMLSLLSMIVANDWYTGALAGQSVLMCFGPLTSLAVFALAHRYAGSRAAWLAALVHVSIPWTYRISTIAYAEGGLTFFLTATVLAVRLHQLQSWPDRRRGLVFIGVLAGSAMACKYTGLVLVVIPAVILVCWLDRHTAEGGGRRLSMSGRMARPAAVLLGVAVAIGPWLLKNAVETGNPVYPLAYSVFGGADWNEQLNARWRAAHAPPGYSLSQLLDGLLDVSARNDWTSPLCLTLAIFSLVAPGRKHTGLLWMGILYLFAAWWTLTHRIDRFWIPMLPLVSTLAGIGAVWSSTPQWRWTLRGLLLVLLAFNLSFITTPYCGNNQYLAKRELLERVVEPAGIRRLNAVLPKQAKVLCVGEAEVFNARFPLVYNTVFDVAWIELWMREESRDDGSSQTAEAHDGADDKPLRLRHPEDFRAILQAAGITHIYVNWAEILRYRTTYGYTDFVQPELFGWMINHGLIDTGREIQRAPIAGRSKAEREQLQQWGRDLVDAQQQSWIAAELFRVLPVSVPE